jgi:hypothetical protein
VTQRPQQTPATPALHDRAIDNLRFIRGVMSRAGEFTAVPGWGGAAMGATAIVAAAAAARQPTLDGWLLVWLGEAALACLIGFAAMFMKATASGAPLASGPARRFALGFTPPVLAGGVLTVALYRAGAGSALPSLWLLLYGCAVVTGGAASVRAVPIMGAILMLFGLGAAVTPAEWGNLWLGAGFGLVQIAFGIHIARRYGG